MKVIQIIEESIKTHIDWIVYFKKQSGTKNASQFKYVDNIAYHERCIQGYNKAIEEIKQLQDELKKYRIKDKLK